MLRSLAATAGVELYKRAATGGGDDDVEPIKRAPAWVLLVLLANFVVFLPVLAYISYTLGHVFPTLTIVEHTDPPAYEPISIDEAHADANAPNKSADGAAGKPVTSSLRAINRLLYSVGGWRGSFRGLAPFIVYSLAVSVVTTFFNVLPQSISWLGMLFGTLIASLLLVQLSAAWVHIVISPPNAAPFWRRLPPFGKTLAATWLPTLAAWAAGQAAAGLPALTAYLLHLPLYDPRGSPRAVPAYDGSAAWKLLVVLAVSLAVTVLAVVPAQVVLVRVQASLLPPDDDAIVPFDRTYAGTVEPAVVGRGYVSARDALRTFPAASWVRLYKLYAKIVAVVFVAYVVVLAVCIPQAILLKRVAGNAPPTLGF